jgi:hypothetical protein
MPWRTVDRSARDVVEVLERFVSGEPTGFLADDFICTPTSDPRLDEVRHLFDQLALQHPEWEPQQPPKPGGQSCEL